MQTDVDTRSVKANIDLIKKLEEEDFNTFYAQFSFIIEKTESKFKKILKKKEKLLFCNFVEKEIQKETIKDSVLRET